MRYPRLAASILATVLLAAWSARAGDALTGQVDGKPAMLYLRGYLSVPFDTLGWKLGYGNLWVEGEGIGFHRTRAIALVGPKGFSEVRSPRDLKHQVTIRSDQEALAFVRLLTSPALEAALQFQSDQIEGEIIARRDLTDAFFFGLQSADGWPRGDADGYWGVVQTSTPAVKPLLKVRNDPGKGRWTIDRRLMRRPLLQVDGMTAWRVREIVTADGGYSRPMEKREPVKLSSDWRIRLFH
jgi:hypothetical protein